MLPSYLIHHFGKIVECRNDLFIAFAKSKILRPKKKKCQMLAECQGIQHYSIIPQDTALHIDFLSSQEHMMSECLTAENQSSPLFCPSHAVTCPSQAIPLLVITLLHR